MTEKAKQSEFGRAEKRNLNHTFLAQAAVADHALTPLQAMRTYWRAFLWCMFMCIGALSGGYDMQLSGGLLSVPQFRSDFGFVWNGEPVLPASWQSAFSCSSSIGSALGGFSMGWISDMSGRRGAVAFGCVASILGVLIQFLSPPHANAILLVGKLINGSSLGIFISCASGYCVEVSPLALRGISTAAVALGTVLGIFVFVDSISTSVQRGTANWTTVYAYRLPIALQWIFPVALLIGLPFAPESPWWLVRKGRYEDADTVLIHLGGPMIDAKLQRQQLRETIELEETYTATSTYKDCFKGENLKRTAIAIMVFVAQQGTGPIFILAFSTYFFELAGFSTSKAFDLTMGGNSIAIVGNLLGCYGVNRIGRRFLFSCGMVACTIILLLIGFIWIWNTHQSAKWAVAVLTMIYHFVYKATLLPVAFVISAEVPSAKLRLKAVGIAYGSVSLCSMIVFIVVPYLVNPDEANLGGYICFIFGGISIFGTIWAYSFVPETKGRTVAELDLLYEMRVPARHFGTYRLYDDDMATL